MSARSSSTQKEFTILILGMTGVGKSTFINSIANYLSFETLEEAIKETPHCIIPTRFTHTIRNFGGKRYTELNIEMNGQNALDSHNEDPNNGKSSTQAPRSYSFIQSNIKINVIDVPGIGDTSGYLVDERNKRAIMEKIAKFPEIHSVWIMMKATETRSTIEFLYSLNDVFSVIPRNAVENISFIITNSKASDFTPGHTLDPLKIFVEDLNTNHNMNINIDDTTFCVDSESFRFQVAYYCNDTFKLYVDTVLPPQTREQHYERCWTESRESTMSLLGKTLGARAKSTKSFLAINEARILIPCFLNAAAMVLHLIEKNKSTKFKTELKNSLMRGTDIQNDINVNKGKLPQTVCTSKKCIKWKTKPDGSKIFEFTQVCHNNCHLTNVIYGKTPQDALIDCQAFNIYNNCIECGCNYAFHTHIHYNFQNIVRTISIKPKTAAESEAYIKKFFEQLEALRAGILNAFTIAYRYLHQHAILTYNTTLIDRLNMEIRVQESNDEKDSEVINNLKKIVNEHEKLIQTLDSIKNIALKEPVTYAEFQSAINQVFNMPPFGTKIKEIYDSERDSASQYSIDFKPLLVKHLPTV